MTELPNGWVSSRLADVADVRLGRQRSPKNATGDRMRPYLRAANVKWAGLDLSDVNEMAFTAAESQTYELRPGDLLLGEASGSPSEVGKPGQYQGEIEGCCFQNTLLRVRLPDELLPDFYEHYFREQALNGRFAAGSRGVGIRHLGAAALSDWTIPVPPSAEQERIVTAIEEAFSKLDAGEAGLRTTRQLLKRMRDAILTAAVTGRLVPQDPTDTPAAKLLADLGVEEISPPDAPQLPAGWCWAELGDTAFDSGYGTSVKCSHDADGPGVLRIPNIRAGRVDLTDLKRAPASATLNDSLLLAPGDLLIIRTNGSQDLIGRCAAVTASLGCSFASYLIRFRLRTDLLDGSFASLQLSAQWWRRRLESSAASSAGQYNLSLRGLAPTPIALPPLEEQVRIVAEVERQFSFVEACERAVDVGLARASGLRRSVLKAAFEGLLVPQDPSDEPGTVLLERIRAERSVQPVAKRRARQTA
jgi:type I restriction enzyme S subunit